MTELPEAKHPAVASVAAEGAFAAQFAISVEEFAGVAVMLETPVVVEQEAPPVSDTAAGRP